MKQEKYKIGAYYYPGWHSCPVRDASFCKGWSEWDLVFNCKAKFKNHKQPKIPLWGREDESKHEVFEKKINVAHQFGIDFFVFAFYWSRRKRLLDGALNNGFLKAKNSQKLKFALMWANRMPRKVMPVKDTSAKLIDPSRLVFTDPSDFMEFIEYVSEKYFVLPNYYNVKGKKYLSIFDTAFFIKQMGIETVKTSIQQVRSYLASKGFKLHLAAIDPIIAHRNLLKDIGFDSVTHYVFLPEWKGKHLQDFTEASEIKTKLWYHYEKETNLPYVPSVSPGWDANPRATDYGKEKEGRYPWSPVIINNTPERFEELLSNALSFTLKHSSFPEPTCMIASWNEWSEGHYLEPDTEYGYKWLQAIKNAKTR